MPPILPTKVWPGRFFTQVSVNTLAFEADILEIKWNHCEYKSCQKVLEAKLSRILFQESHAHKPHLKFQQGNLAVLPPPPKKKNAQVDPAQTTETFYLKSKVDLPVAIFTQTSAMELQRQIVLVVTS